MICCLNEGKLIDVKINQKQRAKQPAHPFTKKKGPADPRNQLTRQNTEKSRLCQSTTLDGSLLGACHFDLFARSKLIGIFAGHGNLFAFHGCHLAIHFGSVSESRNAQCKSNSHHTSYNLLVHCLSPYISGWLLESNSYIVSQILAVVSKPAHCILILD
jgi:hypothetical protein